MHWPLYGAEFYLRRARIRSLPMNKSRMMTILCCAFLLAGIAGSWQRAAAQTAADDKHFITVAGQADLAEIKQSELALEKSRNKDVRAFAKRMVKDHHMLMDKMKPFAAKYKVPPPALVSTDQDAQYSALQGLSGTEFNKAYIEDMDKDHHKALALFDAELAATTDSDLKATVTAGRAVVADHTQMADALAQKMGVSVAMGRMGQRAYDGL
jgi:putative membrane protein